MTTLIIDFDSTLVQVEALDELARIALAGAPDRDERVAEIERLTAAGMDGAIGFGESLARRLKLFAARREHVDELITLLRRRVTPSWRECYRELVASADRMYVISGGFHDYIEPVVAEFGIGPEQVLANQFVFDDNAITGCDTANPLAQDAGKVEVVRGLGLGGRVIMVGDGNSDAQVADAGLAGVFVAFTENVTRPPVVERADYVAANFGEVLAYVTGGATARIGIRPA